MRLGELLVAARLVDEQELSQALAAQTGLVSSRKIGEVLVERGLISESQLTQTLSRQLAVPWVSLGHVTFHKPLLAFVPQAIAEQFCLIPVLVRQSERHGNTLYVAIDDPTDDVALEAVALGAGIAVRPMIAAASEIRRAIRMHYNVNVSPSSGRLPAAEATTAAPANPEESLFVTANANANANANVTANAGANARLEATAQPEPKASEAHSVPVVPQPHGVLEPGPGPNPTSEDERRSGPVRSESDTAARQAQTRTLTLLDGTKISVPAQHATPSVHERDGTDANECKAAMELLAEARRHKRSSDPRDAAAAERLLVATVAALVRKGLVADDEIRRELYKL